MLASRDRQARRACAGSATSAISSAQRAQYADDAGALPRATGAARRASTCAP